MAVRTRANRTTRQAHPWDRRAPARHFEPSQLPGWSPALPGKIPFLRQAGTRGS
jgi:hypothetical protein